MADILGVYPKTGYDIKNSTVELPLGLLSTVAAVHTDYDVKISCGFEFYPAKFWK